MKQLIYRSQPFGFDSSMLVGLLTQARRNNLRDNITGALFCRHDVYLQLIEGPSAEIDALYSQICRDDRHPVSAFDRTLAFALDQAGDDVLRAQLGRIAARSLGNQYVAIRQDDGLARDLAPTTPRPSPAGREIRPETSE